MQWRKTKQHTAVNAAQERQKVVNELQSLLGIYCAKKQRRSDWVSFVIYYNGNSRIVVKYAQCQSATSQLYAPIYGHIKAESFMFVKRKKEKGERKWDSTEIRLLIGYSSQFSSLPLPITKRRYNSKRGGGGRGQGEENECGGKLSVMESRPLTGCQFLHCGYSLHAQNNTLTQNTILCFARQPVCLRWCV